VRHNLDLSLIGKVAQLPDDISPIQIGTRGSYRGRNFEIIGRLKVRWDAGTWNEWYAHFTDGWLADAQGEYMMSFRQDMKEMASAAKLRALPAGSPVSLKNQRFTINDTRSITYVGSEGELPFRAIAGEKSYNIDLSGENEAFATIEVAEMDTRVYVGEYVKFADLALRDLRVLEGWEKP
jgi:hypothetical protein